MSARPCFYESCRLCLSFSQCRLGPIRIGGDAERGLYAEFLEEASVILRKPELIGVAKRLRKSSNAWEVGKSFPLKAAGVLEMRMQIAECVQRILEIEENAIEELRASMNG